MATSPRDRTETARASGGAGRGWGEAAFGSLLTLSAVAVAAATLQLGPEAAAVVAVGAVPVLLLGTRYAPFPASPYVSLERERWHERDR